VVAIKSRESDTQLIARQQNLSSVDASALERFVASAPDPRPSLGGARGIGAVCRPKGFGELLNPWSCTVHYHRGGSVRYRVTIDPRGIVNGLDRTGQLRVYGCCVGPHPTE
jgi:hypothetical protein